MKIAALPSFLVRNSSLEEISRATKRNGGNFFSFKRNNVVAACGTIGCRQKVELAAIIALLKWSKMTALIMQPGALWPVALRKRRSNEG